jgi:hypothetical protein
VCDICKQRNDSGYEWMRFLTCTMRTDKAGRRSGSRASSSSRWCVTTSSALSAFTSSAYLRNRTRQTKQHSTTTGTVDHEKSHRAGRRWKWAQSASSKAGEISAGPAAARRRPSTSLYTSRRRPCLSVRRPPAPASACCLCRSGGGSSTAMDTDLKRRRGDGYAATGSTEAQDDRDLATLAWKVVART